MAHQHTIQQRWLLLLLRLAARELIPADIALHNLASAKEGHNGLHVGPCMLEWKKQHCGENKWWTRMPTYSSFFDIE